MQQALGWTTGCMVTQAHHCPLSSIPLPGPQLSYLCRKNPGYLLALAVAGVLFVPMKKFFAGKDILK